MLTAAASAYAVPSVDAAPLADAAAQILLDQGAMKRAINVDAALTNS